MQELKAVSAQNDTYSEVESISSLTCEIKDMHERSYMPSCMCAGDL